MCSAPVLVLPDYSLPFCIETDACARGIGVVLMQQSRPIAFFSRALGPIALSYSTYEKELLAIVMAVSKWRSYLLGNFFIIFTDQQSIKYFMEQRLTTLLQQRWLSKLLGFNYEIRYKKGSDNRVADALSRMEDEHSTCCAITSLQPQWHSEVTNSYTQDSVVTSLISQILLTPDKFPLYSYSAGILRFQNRIYVGNDPTLRLKLLASLHESSIGGHSGIQGTYQRAKLYFYWPGLKSDIQTLIQACEICQRCKTNHSHPKGLLQPLPVPDHAWQHVSMDFIEGLPRSEGRDVILVVVDRMTKYSHFLALSHPFTAIQVAKLFLDNIYKLHGLPASIVSDRDKVFLSKFWQSLFKSLGTSLHHSTAYHPQSDGQTERTNACLEQYLRCMTHDKPTSWTKWLPLAEFWFNTNYHSSLKMSPFKALYGYSPPHYDISPEISTPIAAVTDYLQHRWQMLQLIKYNLTQAQERMKWFSDKKRVDRSFSVGDWVFLKLQPYRQTSIAVRKNLKLSARYYGPFQIEQAIGPVAYKLTLPMGSKIHPVFHFSQLKAHIGKSITPLPVLPLFSPEGVLQVEPLACLGHRIIIRASTNVPQLLIQWTHTAPEDASWTDAATIETNYPNFNP
ncbi:hypothetical protein ACHQM5_007208 [Ranunculus cassubicifolius]